MSAHKCVGHTEEIVLFQKVNCGMRKIKKYKNKEYKFSISRD